MLVLDVNCQSFGNICNLNIYFGIGYILGGICQVGGFCALCVHRVGEFVYFVIHIFVLNIRGATRHQIRIFLTLFKKGGGGIKPMFKNFVANFV